jgi:threonine dehydrogenase-like Zn-dependent dehydrogenase
MRAVVLRSPHRVTVEQDWPEPECGPTDAIVTVHGVGLCGSDASVVAGHRSVPRLPWVLGHEAYGVIETVGARVTDRHRGQLVAVEPNYPCLACPTCRTGRTSGCPARRIVGISEPGMLAERVAVPDAFTWPIPQDWSAEDMVCIEPLTVALNAVALAEVAPGQRCLVLGAGSQGQLVCLAVRHAGGIPFAVDPHGGRLELARSLGAHDDDGGRYPIVIETSGAPSAFEQAVLRAAPGARVIVVGQSTVAARIATFTIVQRFLTIRGCLIYDHPAGFAGTIAAMSEGGVEPGRVVRARFALDDAPRAFAESAATPGKTWITFGKENP